MQKSLPLCVEQKQYFVMLFGATPFYTNVTGSLRLEVQNQTFRCTLFSLYAKEKKQVFLFVLLCFIFSMQFCDHLKFKSREKNTGSCFIEILICIAQKLVMTTHSLEFQIVYKLCYFILVMILFDKFFFFPTYSPNFLKVFLLPLPLAMFFFLLAPTVSFIFFFSLCINI